MRRTAFMRSHLLVRGLTGIALIAFLSVCARAYYAEYLLARAEQGSKPISEYNHLIKSAWVQNPYHNETSLNMATVLQADNEFLNSRQALLLSAAGVNHWQGWEMEGAAWERLAFTDAGTLHDAEKAAVLYDRVLGVNPSYDKGIGRRALLALKTGDWNIARDLAAKLTALDANNRNAVYLRARAAEGAGDPGLAMDLYAELSAGGEPLSGAWFTIREIAEKLKRLTTEASQ